MTFDEVRSACIAVDARERRSVSVSRLGEAAPAVDRIGANAPVVREVEEVAVASHRPRGMSLARPWGGR